MADAYHPDFKTFERQASQARLVPVYRRLMSDTLTPVLAFSKIRTGRRSFLLESVVGGERVARNSFVGTSPFASLTSRGPEVTVERDGRAQTSRSDDPLGVLQSLMREYSTAPADDLPAFAGGAVGYAAYDAVRYFEHLPDVPPASFDCPDLCFMLFGEMVIFDHINKTVSVVANADTRGKPARQAYDEACKRVDVLTQKLRAPMELPSYDMPVGGTAELEYRSNFEREEFMASVERCKEYIRAGDVIQVVLSQRLEAEIDFSPLDIYRALRIINPSPYMFFLETDDVELVGSSPEVMVKTTGGTVVVRPIAGTRPRGRTDSEDRALEEELLGDPKERAEHVMLVDLGRNDVGRVSRYGTVVVDEEMVIERYSHVMHIVSNVTGRLAPGQGAFEALRACVPAGTVSGAPKIRAMEIIDELEPHKRGPYAGAVGWIDFSGNMDTCIAIRTIVVHDGVAYVQAGAGIVADSQPDREYEETLNKARGLLKAIAVARDLQGKAST